MSDDSAKMVVELDVLERGPLVLRQGWVTLTDDASNTRIEISCGAGVGSPFMHLSLHVGDDYVSEGVDMTPFFMQWAADAQKRHLAKVAPTPES